MTRIYVGLLGVILAAPATAQAQDEALRLRVGPVYTNAFPGLEVVLEVNGKGLGAPAGVMNPGDLYLVEDGVRGSTSLGLRKFGDTGRGVTVLLAVDASGSMRGAPLNALRQGLGRFVSRVRDNDKIGVLSFADDVKWEAAWSTSREATRRKLENIEARGHNTVLWDAVYQGLVSLDDKGLPERRHLVVITDGHDEGSAHSLADAIAKAKELRVPVDAIGMTGSDNRYLENLQTLASETQGSYSTASDLDALTQLTGGAIDRMIETPVASFRADKIVADGREHRIGVYWKGADKLDEAAVGVPLAVPQANPQSSPEEPQVNRNTFHWWYGALAGAVGALLLCVLWMVLRKRRGSVNVSEPRPSGSELPHFVPPPVSPDWGRETAVFKVPVQPPPAAPRPPRAAAKTLYGGGFPIPVNGEPIALLVGKSGPLAGRTIQMDRPDFWIGAAENNDLQIEDDAVSANHAWLRVEASTLKVFDNHSTNNTWVNRQPVGDTARIVLPGDEIQIGRCVFTVGRPVAASHTGVAIPQRSTP